MAVLKINEIILIFLPREIAYKRDEITHISIENYPNLCLSSKSPYVGLWLFRDEKFRSFLCDRKFGEMVKSWWKSGKEKEDKDQLFFKRSKVRIMGSLIGIIVYWISGGLFLFWVGISLPLSI
ncbi:MAG: hypothetical protein ACP5JR_07535 [Thermoplasmata archaeon]